MRFYYALKSHALRPLWPESRSPFYTPALAELWRRMRQGRPDARERVPPQPNPTLLNPKT